jgi:hypothetical protein
MQRTDLKIQDGRIIVHPLKLKALKKEARSRITSDGLTALQEAIVDEELDGYVDLIVMREIAEEMRIEIRAMLEKGLK